MLANDHLQIKSSGITKIATALIQEHSHMAEEGPIIWDEIAKIKEYRKRNSIDEKDVQRRRKPETSKPPKMQNILEHISVQEENFRAD